MRSERTTPRVDANSYLVLSMAMDLFDLGGTPQELRNTLRSARCRWLVLSFSTDWLFPPDQSRDLVNALIANDAPVSYAEIRSSCGHDAFLLPDDFARYGEMIRAFINNLSGRAPPPAFQGTDPHRHEPTSIFHERRLDYDRIMELIPLGASVLDFGCGSGRLLARLRQRGQSSIMGVELDELKILTCIQRGLGRGACGSEQGSDRIPGQSI